jgi:hypothetical protein
MRRKSTVLHERAAHSKSLESASCPSGQQDSIIIFIITSMTRSVRSRSGRSEAVPTQQIAMVSSGSSGIGHAFVRELHRRRRCGPDRPPRRRCA